MGLRVSVVVPVYNPGRYLDACVASLRRQSMAQDEFEAIFVDDGSTDGSGVRLDRLAAGTPNVRVKHLRNSGWPGRPRNVGLDMASGEHLLFLDHDDWLGDEALARLVAMADETGADIVVGREVGHGRGVPLELFRRNVVEATLDGEPLVRLMTPHKLFRRSMLEAHAIRFPEGRRRFEDHVFVLRAYFAARRISILADYPCYHWITRAGQANASDAYADPRSYYADLRDVLDILDEHTEPGPLRDRLVSHWYRRRCLDRLRGDRWTSGPGAHDLDVFEAVRDLARERIGPGVVASLPLSHRLRSGAVHADDPELVTRLARVEHGLRARVRAQRLEREGPWLRVDVTADVVDASGAPMRFEDGPNGRVRWVPTDRALRAAYSPTDLDATADLRATTVAVVIRGEDGALAYDVPATVTRSLRAHPDGAVLAIRAHADVDLRSAAAGLPLPDGAWELFVRVESCGWSSTRRLPHVGVPSTRTAIHVTRGAGGGVGLQVGDAARSAIPRRTAPTRLRSRRHPVERLVPRALVRLVPLRLRRLAKRVLVRIDRRAPTR